MFLIGSHHSEEVELVFELPTTPGYKMIQSVQTLFNCLSLCLLACLFAFLSALLSLSLLPVSCSACLPVFLSAYLSHLQHVALN